MKVRTVFGGKNPNSNDLVGGAPCCFNLEECNAILGSLPRVLLVTIRVAGLHPGR